MNINNKIIKKKKNADILLEQLERKKTNKNKKEYKKEK